jgi:hypothetical protein
MIDIIEEWSNCVYQHNVLKQVQIARVESPSVTSSQYCFCLLVRFICLWSVSW